MVATITTLSGTSSSIASYFDLMDADVAIRYYASEFGGLWSGLGAKDLGLKDQLVTKQGFEQILAGRRPDGTELVKRRKRPKPSRSKKNVPSTIKINLMHPHQRMTRRTTRRPRRKSKASRT